jgi:hypothetical protein
MMRASEPPIKLRLFAELATLLLRMSIRSSSGWAYGLKSSSCPEISILL